MRLIDSKIMNPFLFELEFRDKRNRSGIQHSFYQDYIKNTRLVIGIVAILDFLANFARFKDFHFEFILVLALKFSFFFQFF